MHDEILLIFIDLFQALKGVVAFYSKKDIPGDNVFAGPTMFLMEDDEELFVGTRVKFHGQPVGVLVAESYELAHKAAKLVKVEYASMVEGEPMRLFSTIEEVLADENATKERVTKKELNKSDVDFDGKNSL